MTTRDEIAQVIREYLPGADGKSDSQTIAGEIMPLVRRAQTEALREAAELMLDGDEGLPFDDDQDVAIPSAWLMEHADRIEKEGAGA